MFLESSSAVDSSLTRCKSMRILLSVTMLFLLFLAGCGEPAAEPIEGPDPAEELTDEEVEAEQELN